MNKSRFSKKSRLFIACILSLFFNVSVLGLANAGTFETISIQQNDAFRRDIMAFVEKSVADKTTKADAEKLDKQWFNGGSPTFYLIHWTAKVSIYYHGKQIGLGKASTESLSKTLQDASAIAAKQASSDLTWSADSSTDSLKDTHFKITFYYPPDARQYSMVNNDDKTYELVGNILPVRQLDTALLKERVQLETAYLLRMMDPEMHAFFKKYDAKTDQRDEKLRTIYTASSLYTLLQVQEIMPNAAIEKQIEPIAAFILMMQNHEGENAGAFHYSYDEATGKKDPKFDQGRFVVGTSSKTIFTLLKLYERTQDIKFLNAAKQAGNWLMTRVDNQGHVHPVVVKLNGQLLPKTKQSFLYSGQVLSALSRLYAVTHEQAYYSTATRIAQRMLDYVENKSAFLGDDYRQPNSVTTSWVVMSLVDYIKANPTAKTNKIYQEVITRCANELIYRQIRAPWDTFNDGRLMDIITSSGNGWVNEVMTELYPVCQIKKMQGCQSYRNFIISSSRWLVQSVYTPANSFAIKNPEMASGGVIRNFAENSVRTDAVCHGLNSLVGLLTIAGMENQALAFLPEMPFDEVLGLLEMGRE